MDILQKHFKKDHVHMRLWTLDEVLGYNISSKLKETEQKRKVIMNFHTHSKNTRDNRDPEKGPLGPNSIPGQR